MVVTGAWVSSVNETLKTPEEWPEASTASRRTVCGPSASGPAWICPSRVGSSWKASPGDRLLVTSTRRVKSPVSTLARSCLIGLFPVKTVPAMVGSEVIPSAFGLTIWARIMSQSGIDQQARWNQKLGADHRVVEILVSPMRLVFPGLEVGVLILDVVEAVGVGGREGEEGPGTLAELVEGVAGQELGGGAVLDQVGAEVTAGGKGQVRDFHSVLIAGEDGDPVLDGGPGVAAVAGLELADLARGVVDQEQAKLVAERRVAILEREGGLDRRRPAGRGRDRRSRPAEPPGAMRARS